MAIELDHAFIACRPGAPEADALIQCGLVEGSPNTHPGQGTANRRFFFENFKLELLWVADPQQVTSEQTRRTRLGERCHDPESASCPFGILFRADAAGSPPPFETWSYHPDYLPPGLAIEFAEGTTLDEPELIYLPFVKGHKPTEEPTRHGIAVSRVRSVSVGVRSVRELSAASLAVQTLGLVRYFDSPRPLLEIHFEGESRTRLDLRPVLPLVLNAGD